MELTSVCIETTCIETMYGKDLKPSERVKLVARFPRCVIMHWH